MQRLIKHKTHPGLAFPGPQLLPLPCQPVPGLLQLQHMLALCWLSLATSPRASPQANPTFQHRGLRSSCSPIITGDAHGSSPCPWCRSSPVGLWAVLLLLRAPHLSVAELLGAAFLEGALAIGVSSHHTQVQAALFLHSFPLPHTEQSCSATAAPL